MEKPLRGTLGADLGRRGGRDRPQPLLAKIPLESLPARPPGGGGGKTQRASLPQLEVQPARAWVSGWQSSRRGRKGEPRLAPSPTHSDGIKAQESLHAARAVLDGERLVQVLEGGGLGRVEAVMAF